MIKIKKIFILIILILSIFTFMSCNDKEKNKSYSYYNINVTINNKNYVHNNILLTKSEDFYIKMPDLFSIYNTKNQYEEVFEENYMLVVSRNIVSNDKVIEYTNFKFENNTIYFDVKILPSWIVSFVHNFNNWPTMDLVVIPKIEFPQDFNPDEEHGLVINSTFDDSYVSKDCFPIIRISLDDYVEEMKELGIERTQKFITNYEELKETFDENPNKEENIYYQYIFNCEEYFDESVFDNNVILYVVRLDPNKRDNVEQIYYDIKVKGDKIILKEGSRNVSGFGFLDIHYDFVVIPKSKFPEDFDFEKEYEWKIKNKFVDSLRPRLGIYN